MKRRASAQKTGVTKKRKVVVVPRAAPHQQMVLGKSSAAFKPELKSLDVWGTAVFGQGTGSAGHNALLNCPTPGTNRYNRIGRRIQVKKIHVRCSLHPPQPTQDTIPEDLFVALVVDVEALGLISLADLKEDVNSVGTLSNTVYAHGNLDNSARFIILKKKVIPLRHCGTVSGVIPCNGGADQFNQDMLDWEWNVKTDIKTQFNGVNGGTIADISSGSILLVWWTSQSGLNAPAPQMNYSTRVRYLD